VILIVGAGVTLSVGSTNAETAAVAELEAPETADAGIRDPASDAEQRELGYQRRQEWLAHARAVLFDGIELSAEQSRGVDAIIEAQLKDGRRADELRAELGTAQQQGDTERIRAKSRAFHARRKGPHERMEEMRTLLSEEQRPTFDTNRARLAAEIQQPRKGRRQRRPRAGAEVEAE